MATLPEKVITRNWGKDGSHTFAGYQKNGGYDALKKALSMTPAAVMDEVKKSNLRGRGGAGFPTGLKWSFVPKDSPKPKYLAINADESEPGTFKDRYIMEYDPHMMLEGIAIASYALDVHAAYIYIRGEFKLQAERVQAAIDEAYQNGIFGKSMLGQGYALDCYLVRGAGAYICGEETALLESLEGKKGWPRLKPPFPAVVGLFGAPTVVNNVETLASVPAIINKGSDWYAKLGTDKSGGTRMVCLSGTVNRPGVYEISLHTTVKELIFDDAYGQGMPKGRTVKAVIPGGSSAPVLAANEIDVALEFEALKLKQNMAGSGGVIVMDDTTCMVRCLWRVARFYAEESCGQCTPCREGTPWQTRLLRKIEEGRGEPGDIEILLNVASSIAPYPPIGLGNTICALGDAAALPTHSFVTKFRDEFEAHITQHRCPYGDKPWGHFGEGRPSNIELILFWLFAVLTFGSAANVVMARSPINSAMSLVATFFFLAGIYVLLYAHTIAVLQILVYAGAIMVLFLFVIMLLSLGEEQGPVIKLSGSRVVGALTSVLLLGALLLSLFKLPIGESINLNGANVMTFGTIAQLGNVLYTQYLFPFEAVSLLLLVAIVGAVVVAKSRI